MSPRGEGDEKSGGCQGEDRGDAGSPYAWYADEWVEPVVFRTEQQMEVSCPFPGTPPEGGQNTDPYGLVDSSYLYEDCYKSQDDDNNSIKDLTPTNYDTRVAQAAKPRSLRKRVHGSRFDSRAIGRRRQRGLAGLC